MKILKKDHSDRLTLWDDIILSTDEQTNLIYIYKPSVPKTGNNKIDIYFYENNIVNTDPATSLPIQIWQMENYMKQKEA